MSGQMFGSEEEGDGHVVGGLGETGRDTVFLNIRVKMMMMIMILMVMILMIMVLMMMIIITGPTQEKKEEEVSHWPPHQESWCKTKRKTRCQEER